MKATKVIFGLILLMGLTTSCVDSLDDTEALYEQNQESIDRDEIKETDV